MNFDVYWYVEYRILMLIFPQVTMLKSLYAIAEKCASTLDSVEEKKAHLLIDASSAHPMPNSLVATKNALTPLARHTRLGHCVLFGTHNLQIQQNWALLAKITRINLHITRTSFEAVHYLQRLDKSLPRYSDDAQSQL